VLRNNFYSIAMNLIHIDSGTVGIRDYFSIAHYSCRVIIYMKRHIKGRKIALAISAKAIGEE
jgi:hypothetical protein